MTKEITICGHQVEMIYCAATENAYEDITNRSIGVFVPKFGKNDKGEDVVIEKPKATIGDFIALGMAGIIAAYTRKGEPVPIEYENILFDATPEERNCVLDAIVELRNEWYKTPKAVEDLLKKEAEANKGDDEDAEKN